MITARHLCIVANGHRHRALRASIALLAVVSAGLGFASASRADVVINELRGSGTAADDDYVELFNRGAAPVNMLGWRLDARAGDDGAAGTVTLPAQTLAPRGKLLVTAPGYSLGALAGSNDAVGGELPAGGSVALIDPSNATQDAVHFAPGTVFGEGGPLGSFAAGGQYAFVRRVNRTGAGDGYGLPTDTGDNAADFALVVPEGSTSSAGSALPSIEGVPGPENLGSAPLANAALQVGRLDPTVATNVAPNRQIVDPDGAGPLAQTLYLRRTVTNVSGAELTAVQFRVSTITTARSDPQAGQSVIRLDSSDNTSVASKPITPVALQRSLQTPLPDGGGLNSVVSVPSITPIAPLAPGASINVEFALRIAQPGAFQVILNTEAKRANDAPTDISLTGNSVDENQPSGTSVGTLSTTDPDPNDTHGYSLTTGAGDTDNGAFQIVGDTLQTNQSFDFETKSSYSIRVRSTDDGSPAKSVDKVFTVSVTDANDAPSVVSLSNSSVDENQPAGTTVGTLSAADQDSADTHTFALVSGSGSTDNGAFQITGSTLQTSQSFDFETKSSYSIRVRATDSGSPAKSVEKVFTISVTDVNEAPTDIALSKASVDENQPSGTTVGTLSTTDPDAGDTFTYSLVSGTGSTDNGAFQITGTTLQTSQSFNFETKSSYSIRVRSTDSGNQNTEKQFTITITNVNDAPSDIALSNASVAENQPSGTTVGTLSTTDQDAGDTFTYSLVSGTGSTDNGAFQITGSTLQTNESFNFEAKSSYSIRVRSTDSGNQNTEKVFTITITNVNDAPSDIALSNANVDENKPSGSTVGTLSTTDEDAGDTFTYSLVAGAGSGDNAAFKISGSTLQTNQSFNFEAKSSYTIRVRSTDSGNQNTEKQFTITINDVNDPPVPGADASSTVGNTLLAWGGAASVPAGQAGKDVTTGNVLANDTDEDQPPQTLSMDVAGSSTTTPNGGAVAWFSDGSFRYTPAANFTGNDTLTYKVTDGAASVNGTVTVSVANKVWYVKNNQAAGGNGRSTEPFDTLAEAQNASAANDDIYVFRGDAITTGQNAGIALKSSQRLLGEAVSLVVSGDTLFAGNAANRPAISGNPGVKLATGSRVEGLDVAGSGGPAVCAGTAAPCTAAAAANGSTVTNVNLTGNSGGFNLAGGTGTFTLSNFSVSTTGGTGLRANNAGTLTVPSPPTTTVNSTNGPAVDIQSTGGSVVLDNATSTTSPGAGINLDNNGTGTFTATAGSITGAGGNAVDINNGSGNISYGGNVGDGTGNTADITGRSGGAITLSGNINDTNDTGGGITMSGNTGGSTTFSGTTKTLNTGTAAAFSSTGSGHTINLTGGGLDIDTTTGNGLSATGGGTINVTTGTNPNTIDTTTGTALNVANTNIGASGLTFRSISAGTAADSAGNGIVLDATGNSGGLTVTGNGTAGSGGTIRHKTGADGSTAGGIGIYLNNTQSPSFARMQLDDFQNFAIRGTSVNGFSLANSTVDGVNGTSAGADEGSVIFDGLTGTTSMTSDTIKGGIEDNVRVRNSSGTMDFTMTGSTIRDTSTSTSGNDNLILEAHGTATETAHVQNNTFAATNGDHLQTVGDGSATLSIVFAGNTLSGGGGANALGQGITISGGSLNPTSTEHVNFNVSNNTMSGTVQGGAINVNEGNGNGVWQGQVSNNVIGTAAVVGSGCAQCGGIRVENHSPSGTLTGIVSGNTIRQWSNGPAINSQAGDAGNASNAAKINLTVTNNTAANPGTNTQHGFVANIGAGPAGDASVACTDVRSNTLDGNAAISGGVGVRLRQRNSSTIKIPGYTGTQYDISAVAAFEVTQNPASTANAATSSLGPGFTNTSPAGAACLQPTVPQ